MVKNRHTKKSKFTFIKLYTRVFPKTKKKSISRNTLEYCLSRESGDFLVLLSKTGGEIQCLPYARFLYFLYGIPNLFTKAYQVFY